MAVFSGLSDKLNHIFSKLKSRGKLTALEIKEAMREVRIALLEADVNYLVAKTFVAKVSEKALGEEVLKSLTPAQQVIKIVRDELTELLGAGNAKLQFGAQNPAIILMCGLQGAGKTSTCGKLAYHLKQMGKKPLLVACDIYRPAAIEQLKVVGKTANAEVFERGTQNPVKTAREAVEYAKSTLKFDVVIIDTAGRLHIDDALMQELEQIKAAVNPAEILLVVDSMTGQDAVNVSQTYNERLGITGVILSKLDGDTRGGAALSIKEVTGKPIKFISTGEKVADLEAFYPDRMASRILGMGDVLSLIEKVEATVEKDEAAKLQKAIRENAFTFDDYLVQMERLNKMGGVNSVMAMLPSHITQKLGAVQVDEKELRRNKAIIQSMTPYERQTPNAIKGGQRKRIAAGSGTSIQDVNKLLRQFENAKNSMKMLSNNKMARKKLRI
ncbi:MAG: signal recognition particle protein [Clostridia bacterium]|nr:signal recognition particle protein [Clostridia bacterium]